MNKIIIWIVNVKTMKKYKHKKTGWTASDKGSSKLWIEKLDGSYVGAYPLVLLEDSEDWVEVRPISNTEDGKDIFEGDTIYRLQYTTRGSSPTIAEFKKMEAVVNTDFNHWKLTEEDGLMYLKDREPLYSKNDVIASMVFAEISTLNQKLVLHHLSHTHSGC